MRKGCSGHVPAEAVELKAKDSKAPESLSKSMCLDGIIKVVSRSYKT
jgi:hypothetical protein